MICAKCNNRQAVDGFTWCAVCDLPGVNAVRRQNNLSEWTPEQLEARMKERDPKTFARRSET